jgi:hypothetical protein
MKTLIAACLIATAVAAPLSVAVAQTPAPATVPLPSGPASPESSAAPGEKTDLNQPVTLMPETPPTIPKPSARESSGGLLGPTMAVPQLPETRKSKTTATEEDLKQRIRFREIKTQALKDPHVQEEWERAQSAPTDLEKRDALRRYYTQLFARMAKIDSSLAAKAEQQKKVAIGRLDQSRVRRNAQGGGPAADQGQIGLSEE